MTIKIRQSSSFVDERRWNWSVWLAGDATELDRIEYVTYTLHPTFPNPVRKIQTRKGGFRLISSGWGEFKIYIDIMKKDGEHYQLSHDLKLKSRPPKRAASEGQRSPYMLALENAIPAIKGMANAIHDKVIGEVADLLPRSTVFVSGGVVDAEAVHRLSNSLARLNVRILSPDDISGGVPFQIHTEKMIEQANLAVFLISGRPSLWMDQEIETAKRYGKRIVPILVGTATELPEALRDLPGLHIDRLDSVADLAQVILKL